MAVESRRPGQPPCTTSGTAQACPARLHASLTHCDRSARSAGQANQTTSIKSGLNRQPFFRPSLCTRACAVPEVITRHHPQPPILNEKALITAGHTRWMRLSALTPNHPARAAAERQLTAQTEFPSKTQQQRQTLTFRDRPSRPIEEQADPAIAPALHPTDPHPNRGQPSPAPSGLYKTRDQKL